MLRIFIVTNSLAGGGAERSMNLVANGLASRGYEVYLVPINFGPEDLVRITTNVLPINRPWNGGLRETFFAFIRYRGFLNQYKPDILILNCELPELFGSLCSNRSKVVVVEHTSRVWRGRVSVGVLVRLVLIIKLSRFIGVSENLRIWPLSRSIERVIHNPLPPEFFVTRKECPESFHGERRLVFVGRLAALKRADIFLQICEFTKIPGLIIGEGTERVAIEKRIKEKDLNVRLLGNIDNPWLKLNSQDLLVVSSDYEGDGLVVVEGLAHGLPMILIDNLDLRKFGFPDINYFTDANHASVTIKSQSSFASFLVPKDHVQCILKHRSVEEVVGHWEHFISGLYKPIILA